MRDSDLPCSRAPMAASTPPAADPARLLRVARTAYQLRRRRDRMFGAAADIFRDPAWDIMLDLFVNTLAGKTMAASSAALAACVPGTTALRCLDLMIQRGLIRRFPDPQDGRRTLVELTPLGMELMTRTLAVEAARLSPEG